MVFVFLNLPVNYYYSSSTSRSTLVCCARHLRLAHCAARPRAGPPAGVECQWLLCPTGRLRPATITAGAIHRFVQVVGTGTHWHVGALALALAHMMAPVRAHTGTHTGNAYSRFISAIESESLFVLFQVTSHGVYFKKSERRVTT